MLLVSCIILCVFYQCSCSTTYNYKYSALWIGNDLQVKQHFLLTYLLYRLRCKVTMNGSPIEDKMDLNANPPSINDRLYSIDNKVSHALVLNTNSLILSTYRKSTIITP